MLETIGNQTFILYFLANDIIPLVSSENSGIYIFFIYFN